MECGRSMKKMLFVAIGVVAPFVVLEIVEMLRLGKWIGGAILAVLVAVAIPLVIFLARPKPVKGVEELDDNDGGIDWREGNAGGEVVQMWNGWAVLLNDAPVHEAKALAEKLESEHMRCRLELLKEDRAFHLYGNGGMGTRMCVLVAPGDYGAAKKALALGFCERKAGS